MLQCGSKELSTILPQPLEQAGAVTLAISQLHVPLCSIKLQLACQGEQSPHVPQPGVTA